MRVLEADLDRIRLSVWRPARLNVSLLILAIAVLVGGPLWWWANVVSKLVELRSALAEPPPEPLDCSWTNLGSDPHCAELAPNLLELPTLAQVYLARRGYHRAELFPSAFTAPPPPIAPLKTPFAELVRTDYERWLMGQVLRDAGVALDAEPDEGRPAGWLGRDPILGVPLGGRALDDTVTMDRILAFQPSLDDDLVDHRATPIDELVQQDILRETAEGHRVADPVALAHLADRAVNDVRYFAALRSEAVAWAIDGQHAAAFAVWEEERSTLEAEATRWRERRRAGLPAVIGAWGMAALLVVPVVWQLRRRMPLSLDLHAITFGDRRILWEQLDELIWTGRRVTWRLESGVEGTVGDLFLSDADVRMLERTSDALWLHDRDAPTDATKRAIRLLVDGARRGDGR